MKILTLFSKKALLFPVTLAAYTVARQPHLFSIIIFAFLYSIMKCLVNYTFLYNTNLSLYLQLKSCNIVLSALVLALYERPITFLSC